MSWLRLIRVLASVWISFQPVWDSLFQGVDEPLHQVLSQARLLGAVGLDEVLVDAPGGLDRSVALNQRRGSPGARSGHR